MELTDNDIKRFWNKVDKKGDDDCWGWFAMLDSFGYGKMRLNKMMVSAHRISYLIANGYLPEAPLIIRHKCKTKVCINPNHLETGTHLENMGDKIRDGSQYKPSGEKHSMCKLSEAQVLEIRKKYIPWKYSTRKLAKEYNVSQVEIYRIIKRETWAHI